MACRVGCLALGMNRYLQTRRVDVRYTWVSTEVTVQLGMGLMGCRLGILTSYIRED